MALDEWEILPHDGLLDYKEDGENQPFLARKHGSPIKKSVFNMNYFMPPSSPPRSSRVVPNHLVPVPFQLEPARTGKDPDEELSREVISEVPIGIHVVPSLIMPKGMGPGETGPREADQDSVSQVFFKKMKENEFVDMKILDSPKSCPKGFVPPQIDSAAGKFNFDDNKVETLEANQIGSPRIKHEKDNNTKEEVAWVEKSGGLNIWKWSLTGIGAICSFGVAAAATICIIIIGSHQKNNQQHQNQELRFKIYTDDKRIKQVVRHATKLNEAISAVRGVPVTRAHITYGGYYDSL